MIAFVIHCLTWVIRQNINGSLMISKSKKHRNDSGFFSLRGTYSERMPTAAEVFERRADEMRAAQDSITIKPHKKK